MNKPFSQGEASPAAVRNTPPITDVLQRVLVPHLTPGALVLGIAEGAGYHAFRFAGMFPNFIWQPSDADKDACARMADVVVSAELTNLRPPVQLDVCAEPWPISKADAITCINMIHISPWEATLALFRGAAQLLSPGQLLLTYGPYSIAGDFLSESNVDFDVSLRTRNLAWGIREVNDVQRVAEGNGFSLEETIRMPANNLMVIFRHRS